MVEKRLVTQRRRPIPADMLLIQERRRRTAGSPHARPGSEDALASEEIFVSDEDQLIESEPLESVSSSAAASGDVLLRRPIAQVSLAKVSWSGPIDHDALQEAMLCAAPVDKLDILERAGLFLDQPFWRDDGNAALEVTLRASDLDVLRSLAAAGARLQTAPIIRAARLPERITGAETATRQAVCGVLAAYRRSSLTHAWHGHLSRTDNVQLHRERDEAAVAVLSTLRALLGER
jgi:hypothetical protein